jgi:ribulose-phosphate 3-epimerase
MDAVTAPIEIAPSILAADPLHLGEQVRACFEEGIRRIHVDIMDGHFVPNIALSAGHIAALRPIADEYGGLLEAHLMIEEPDRYLGEFRDAGSDIIEVHVEACRHLHRTTERIRHLGAAPCVALNPATSLSTIDEILPDVDQVLLMSVNPGFGGQAFIAAAVDKVRRLRAILEARGLGQLPIELDGGVTADNIKPAADAGTTVAVAGSSVFGGGCAVAANLATLRAAAGGPG